MRGYIWVTKLTFIKVTGLVLAAIALTISSSAGDGLGYFRTLDLSESFRSVGEGLTSIVIGQSFLTRTNQIARKTSAILELPAEKVKIHKAILYFAGKQPIYEERIELPLVIITPDSLAHTITSYCSKFIKCQDGDCYIYKYDVSDLVYQSGEYSLKSPEMISAAGVQFAGWTLVTLYTSTSPVLSNGEVIVFDGVCPLEQHKNYSLTAQVDQRIFLKGNNISAKIIFSGSGGYTRSGVADFFKGQPISGYEDWIGRSGVKWDVIEHNDLKLEQPENNEIKFEIETTFADITPILMIVEIKAEKGQ